VALEPKTPTAEGHDYKIAFIEDQDGCKIELVQRETMKVGTSSCRRPRGCEPALGYAAPFSLLQVSPTSMTDRRNRFSPITLPSARSAAGGPRRGPAGQKT